MKNDTLTDREKKLLKSYKSYRGGKRFFLILAILLFISFIGVWLSYTGKLDPVVIMESTLNAIAICLILAYAFNARVRHCETLLRMHAENEIK